MNASCKDSNNRTNHHKQVREQKNKAAKNPFFRVLDSSLFYSFPVFFNVILFSLCWFSCFTLCHRSSIYRSLRIILYCSHNIIPSLNTIFQDQFLFYDIHPFSLFSSMMLLHEFPHHNLIYRQQSNSSVINNDKSFISEINIPKP